jgi:hypothetical protein
MAKQKPEKELLALIADHDPGIVQLALDLRSMILDAAPDARETVYDARYTISDIFSFTERWQDSFCMVAVYSKHVSLVFTHGARLPDPHRLLRGSGKQLRHLQARTEDDLQNDALRHFLEAAIARAREELPSADDSASAS